MRRPRQGLVHEAAHGSRRQSGGGWIDGFHLWDVARPFRREHVIRMGDLQDAGISVELDLAADHAHRARRMGPFQVRAVTLEERQGDEPGVVAGANLPGRVRPVRPLVRNDGQAKGLDFPLDGARRRGRSTADQGVRRQKQQIAHQRAGQALQQRCDPRADALEASHGGEQRKERGRTHSGTIAASRPRHPSSNDVRIAI